MSHKHSANRRRENSSPPPGNSSSHLAKARMVIRQSLNNADQPLSIDDEVKSDFSKYGFDFASNLYETGRQERINEIADDDDGDLIVERQAPMISEKTSKIIEANDRRHEAIIFGDKKVEEQQKSQLWSSFKQSSKYATTSLAGPLLLEDPDVKRLRWKLKMRDLWTKRFGIPITNIDMDTN